MVNRSAKNIGSNPAGYQQYFEQEKYHLLWFKPDLIADERRHNGNLILFAHEFGHSIGTLDGGWVDKSSADYGDVPSVNQLFEVVVGQQMNFDMSGYALYRNGELEPNHDLYISPYLFMENVVSNDSGHVAPEQKHITPEKNAELEALFGKQGTKDFDIKAFIKATKFNKPFGRPAYLLKNKP